MPPYPTPHDPGERLDSSPTTTKERVPWGSRPSLAPNEDSSSKPSIVPDTVHQPVSAPNSSCAQRLQEGQPRASPSQSLSHQAPELPFAQERGVVPTHVQRDSSGRASAGGAGAAAFHADASLPEPVARRRPSLQRQTLQQRPEPQMQQEDCTERNVRVDRTALQQELSDFAIRNELLERDADRDGRVAAEPSPRPGVTKQSSALKQELADFENLQKMAGGAPDNDGSNEPQESLPVDSFPNNFCVGAKEWIAGALRALDATLDHGQKVSSVPYMMSSLKIACSLSDQLCQLQGKGDGIIESQLSSPSQGWLCLDQVSIQLGGSKGAEVNMNSEIMSESDADALQRFAEEGRNTSSSTGDPSNQIAAPSELRDIPGDSSTGLQNLQEMLNSLVPDPDLFLKEDGSHPTEDALMDGKREASIASAKRKGSRGDERYLCVGGATLRIGSDPLNGDERMRIHSLGVLFFELFSGGMASEREAEVLRPVVASLADPIEVGTASNILDAIGDDDELFGEVGAPDAEAPKEGNVEEEAPQKVVRAPSSCLSAEHLKLLGLPISLCDLIGNMIDCAGDDIEKDETYSSMEDVRRDLESMLESPGTYLSDLDLDVACKVGLQMDGNKTKLYGRDSELAHLKEIYKQSISTKCEAVIICGPAGIGKSRMTHEFAQYATGSTNGQSGCIFLSGKFDRVQQSQPLSAVASAFNTYCDWLSQDENASIAAKVSGALKNALGKEVHSVAKLVPSLTKIIDNETHGDSGCVDAQKRLRFLLCQILEIISRAHDGPLVFYLDDCQWADQSSIALINQALLASHRFFFLGCCRDDEMEDDDKLWKMLDSVREFGVNATKIKLGCLDAETVNIMVSEKLKLLPRITRPLADVVYFKTKGNPFFIGQLMVELIKDNLLRPSLVQRRWVWEEEEIQELELPKDVILFMTNSLNRLPEDVLSAMCVLSCFGASSYFSLVQKLEREIDQSLSTPLNAAVAEGFIFKKNKMYHFAHDRVQEAVYNTMKTEEVYTHHFNYGLALSAVAEKDRDDSLYLLAVGQINIGGPRAVTDDEQGVKAARLNLSAGKKAVLMSDFHASYWFYDMGISYLKKGHWEDHYDLTMELYHGAAKCALSNGEHSTLNILSDQVLHYAKCFEDKLDMLYVKVTLASYALKFAQAIELGLNALSNLGEELPKTITQDMVASSFERTSAMLDSMSDEEILNHKTMSDSKKKFSMKFLHKLFELANFCQPWYQPIVGTKLVQLSLLHGLNAHSPIAFAYYGAMIAKMGNIRQGYRYARISKALLNKVEGDGQVCGEVYVHSTQLIAYVEPVQSTLDLHAEGGRAAMSHGSTNSAMFNYFLGAANSYWSGVKLTAVMASFEKCRRQVKHHQHINLMTMLMPPYRSVLTLIGKSDPSLADTHDQVFDSALDEATNVEQSLRNKPAWFSNHFQFFKVYMAFMFRRFDECQELVRAQSNKAFSVVGNLFMFSWAMRRFCEGLVSFWIGRETNDREWIARGQESRLDMSKLVNAASSWNFQSKLYLLEAEEQFSERNFELAGPLYDAAISSAREHRFLHEEALANELAGNFYVETGKRSLSLPYISNAIEKYREWEAHAKVESLEKYLRDLLKHDVFISNCNNSSSI